MMPKGDTISAIRQLNTTADPAFLAEFSLEDLQAYLDRLTQPRRLVTRTDPRVPHPTAFPAAPDSQVRM